MSAKEKLTNIGNSILNKAGETATKFSNVKNALLEKMKNSDREELIAFIFSRYGLIICITLILLTMLYYFYYWSALFRIPRYLKKLENLTNYVNPKPFKSCSTLNLSKYKLCDFYIASSSKSYLIGQQTNDYVSADAITKVILAGARMIELDIFNETLATLTEPIVANGIEKGRNIETYNYVRFEECCKTLSECAFSKILISNSDDPLFLYLKLNVDGNLSTLDKVAEIISNYFYDKLLPKEYSYQNINITQTNILDLFGKLIIISTPGFKNSKLDELVNYSTGDYYMRQYAYDEIENAYTPEEITKFNKRYMSLIDANDDISSSNKTPKIPWNYGCQFVGMNYQSQDAGLFEYLNQFHEYSFKLKPYPLRYHPLTYPAPKKQNKKLSFKPLKVDTPFYKQTT